MPSLNENNVPEKDTTPNRPNHRVVEDNEPKNLDEVTTAPQQQLNQLGDTTPKQPIGNNLNK